MSDLEGRRWLTGLVSDANAIVHMRDGRPQPSVTTHGIVVIKDLEPVTTIKFVDATGSQRQQLC